MTPVTSLVVLSGPGVPASSPWIAIHGWAKTPQARRAKSLEEAQIVSQFNLRAVRYDNERKWQCDREVFRASLSSPKFF